ncbi:MAG TPA: hypothetical protein VFQ76_18995 [Longimicrobiaceae bacterium]|nr:hypothetical protein [Longimicrobiaceae bacterium]
MYRTCIFCSADLGSNQSIEEFPVGRGIAFDAARGRLWAVCPRCARWNLAPIEERWEAVEDAEKRFRDARLRAQSENVGLARLADGTRLLRIGRALPGELAAWRYGEQLVRRRRYHLAVTVAGASAATLALGGVALTALTLTGAWQVYLLGSSLLRRRRDDRVVYRRAADGGEEVRVLHKHLEHAYLTAAPAPDEIEICIPLAERLTWRAFDGGRAARLRTDPLRLGGAEARLMLGRAMVRINRKGASRAMLGHAADLLASRGTGVEYVRSLLDESSTEPGSSAKLGLLAPARSLALEMALHEETERRALQGELAALEAAWRDAEEIAAIADSLPDDPPDRLKGA